jgi:hypothetical protein
MPVKASQRSPVQRPSMDGHVSAAGTAKVRPVSAGLDHEPAPMADARARRGVDFEDVLADWDARLASRA